MKFYIKRAIHNNPKQRSVNQIRCIYNIVTHCWTVSICNNRRTYPQMCQILQSRDAGKLQIARVHQQPTVGSQRQQQRPDDHNEHIVEEHQIVDDGKENEPEQAKEPPHQRRPHPGQHSFLVLLLWPENAVKILFCKRREFAMKMNSCTM